MHEWDRNIRQAYRAAFDPKTRTIIRKVMGLVLPFTKPPMPDDMRGRVFDMSKMRLVKLDGFNLYVMPDDYIGHSIIVNRSYEPHVTELISTLLKPGDVFMDVGANVGYFTFLAASLVGKAGKVIAFEPNPQNLHLIYSTALDLPPGFNIEIYPFAVSDAAGILKFTTVGSNGGVVTHGIVGSDIGKEPHYDILVQSVVMDKVLNDESRIDLIKIDVEAHEPAATRGMETLLRKHKPKMITEFHPYALKFNNKEPPIAYLHQLYALGYRLSIIETSGNILNVNGADEIMSYWKALNSETIHLDLYAQS